MAPKEWLRLSVKDCMSFSGGSQPPQSTFVDEPREGYVRLLQIRDFKTDRFPTYIPRELARKTCKRDDVMIGRYGPPIFQVLRGKEGAYNVALIKAIPKNNITKDYMYYFLSNESLFRQIDALSRRSAGQAGVEMDFLKNYPLLLPPLPEQQRISAVLGTLDQIISTVERMIENGKEQSKALIRQLLSKKRRLPGFREEWTERRIEELASRVTRKNDGDDLPILTISSTAGFVAQKDKYSRFMAGKSLEDYILLKHGEFAYNKGNSRTYQFGCVFDLEQYDAALVPHVYVCFRLNPELNHSFYKHLFAFDYLKEQLGRLVNTGVRNNGLLNITPKQFLATSVPVPPIVEQNAIADMMDAMLRETDTLSSYLVLLRREKSALMQQLLTGRRRVILRDAEAPVLAGGSHLC